MPEHRRRVFPVLCCATSLLAILSEAAAFDAVSLTVGHAPGVSSLRGAMIWAPARDTVWPRWFDWTGADLRLELGASAWRSRAPGETRGTLLGVGVLPLLRWNFAGPALSRPFVEFGVGPRLWTGTNIGSGHRFGTALEFGSILGTGLRLDGYDVFARVEHTSNGGIKQPNPGINFWQIGVSWPLDR